MRIALAIFLAIGISAYLSRIKGSLFFCGFNYLFGRIYPGLPQSVFASVIEKSSKDLFCSICCAYFGFSPKSILLSIPIRHLVKESPAISTVFYPGPLASDPASESVSVDAPAKKADSYYYGITFDLYPGFGRKEKLFSAPFS